MYLIDKEANRIKEIEKKTFSELGFKERAHLQEWLAFHPTALGEQLLIIQKEFSGFDDTYERLDLLALDKDGNIVVIENKLDDTGRDVTWQALKYASYCSTLKGEQIANIYQDYLDKYEPGGNAKEKLNEFFSQDFDEVNVNLNQRMILVAASFRKEVTSTVLWLGGFKIRIQCIKATPYQYDGLLFLTLDQIIPTKDAEDFIIKMNDKVQEDVSRKEDLSKRHHIRLEFWAKLLSALKGKTPIFQNNSPTKDNILYAGGTNLTYGSYVFTITKSYCSGGLKLYRESAKENKLIFDELYKQKETIEEKFGSKLEWERADENIQSLILFKLQDANVFDRDDWDRIINSLTSNMVKFELAMRDPLVVARKALISYQDISKSSVEESTDAP